MGCSRAADGMGGYGDGLDEKLKKRKEEKERVRGLGGQERGRRNPDQGETRGTFSVNLVFPYSWMIFALVTLFP